MSKPKQILCIHPDPVELRLQALFNRQGIAVELTEVSAPEALRELVERAFAWDLILCDALSYFDLGLDALLESVRDNLDASLILLKARDSHLSPAEGYRRGAADVVLRGDIDHLLMVCEREFQNCLVRKQVRSLRQAAALGEPEVREPLVVATISDLGKTVRAKQGERGLADVESAPAPPDIPAQTRIKSLIDAGGLTLEFQPIISFKAHEEHRSMFETLVRLKDEAGGLLMPDEFLPIVSVAGWMGRIDLWIFRRALATLEEMQESGARDAVLFINVATETLLSAHLVKAIGTFVLAAKLAPGSIVIEVRRDAFIRAPDALRRLAEMLRTKQHGLLIEDPVLEDCHFLVSQQGLITHAKLPRCITQGLVERTVSQTTLSEFVKCAHHEGIRVIALAVDSAELLPMLFIAGVDAIQGHFVSMPYKDLMYPSVQRIESGIGSLWQASDGTT